MSYSRHSYQEIGNIIIPISQGRKLRQRGHLTCLLSCIRLGSREPGSRLKPFRERTVSRVPGAWHTERTRDFSHRLSRSCPLLRKHNHQCLRVRTTQLPFICYRFVPDALLVRSTVFDSYSSTACCVRVSLRNVWGSRGSKRTRDSPRTDIQACPTRTSMHTAQPCNAHQLPPGSPFRLPNFVSLEDSTSPA